METMVREIDEYLLFLKVEKNLTPRTINEYRMDLHLLLQFLEERGLVEWSQVKQRDLRHFMHYLQEERQNSATARARKVSSMKGFFSFLHEETILKENPSFRLRKPKLEKKLPLYLSQEECQRFIQVLQEHSPNQQRDITAVFLFLYTGIRLTELTQLNVHHVDMENHLLRIYGKGRKERLVPILSPLHRILTSYLESRKETLQQDAISFQPLFFTRRKGKWQRIHQRTIHEIFMQYSQMARLDQQHFSAHKLRHTFATLLYSQGVDLIELKKLLGHTNLSTTEIYTHTSTSQLKEALNKHPLLVGF
jgi:integrase/recombinase XerD